MLLTEEEAKERWCPFARATLYADDPVGDVSITSGAPTFNRLAEVRNSAATNPPACRCIASQCMAWRSTFKVQKNWASSENVPPPAPDAGWEHYGDLHETTASLPQQNRDAGERQFEREFILRQGRCGLAGKP